MGRAKGQQHAAQDAFMSVLGAARGPRKRTNVSVAEASEYWRLIMSEFGAVWDSTNATNATMVRPAEDVAAALGALDDALMDARGSGISVDDFTLAPEEPDPNASYISVIGVQLLDVNVGALVYSEDSEDSDDYWRFLPKDIFIFDDDEHGELTFLDLKPPADSGEPTQGMPDEGQRAFLYSPDILEGAGARAAALAVERIHRRIAIGNADYLQYAVDEGSATDLQRERA